MGNKGRFVKCKHCGASVKTENLPTHLMKVHPTEISIPSVEIFVEGKPLKLLLSCNSVHKQYEETLKNEVTQSQSSIQGIWQEVCGIFRIGDQPTPKVWILVGKGIVGHDPLGTAFSSVPARVDPTHGIVHVSNPEVEVNPYTYYVDSLRRLANEPVLAQSFIHEFCHCAFIMGGTKSRGYILDFAWRATDPDGGSAYRCLKPFADIKPDRTYPLTPATLLTEAPAMWGEEQVGEKLLGNASARIKRILEFSEQQQEKLNQYLGKYFPLSPITAANHARILHDHWTAVRGISLTELYTYVERKLGDILGVDIHKMYTDFERFCSIEIHREYAGPSKYDPNHPTAKSWRTLLMKEFGYIDT